LHVIYGFCDLIELSLYKAYTYPTISTYCHYRSYIFYLIPLYHLYCGSWCSRREWWQL